MNLSGILVTAEPGHVEAVARALGGLPGVEVSRTDDDAGRFVVVQEAPEVGAEVEGFGRIRALPHVLAVDLVCHCFEDADAPAGVCAAPP